MNALLARLRNEPAVVLSLVTALLALVTAFGLDLSADKTAAILGFTSLMVGLVTRGLVTPASAAE